MKKLSEYLSSPEVFIIVKPGFIDKAPQIIEMFSKNGFEFKKMRTKLLTLNESKRLYYVHKNEDFYNNLCRYMSSGPCLGISFDASSIKDPFKVTGKLKDKIRKKYGLDDMRNCMHSSDNPEDMKKESAIFF